MEKDFFVGIMGVPNTTGLWQVSDIRNNGTLKIKWVQAKRYVLCLRREGKMKPLSERRIPEGQHDKLMPTDLVILLNLVFGPSHGGVPANQRTIAQSGVVPFTSVLLEHPEIAAGSSARVVDREAAADAAATAAGDVDLGALNLTGLRRLSTEAKTKRDGAARQCQGMEVPDDAMMLADLGEDGAAFVRRMDGVKGICGGKGIERPSTPDRGLSPCSSINQGIKGCA